MELTMAQFHEMVPISMTAFSNPPSCLHLCPWGHLSPNDMNYPRFTDRTSWQWWRIQWNSHPATTIMLPNSFKICSGLRLTSIASQIQYVVDLLKEMPDAITDENSLNHSNEPFSNLAVDKSPDKWNTRECIAFFLLWYDVKISNVKKASRSSVSDDWDST